MLVVCAALAVAACSYLTLEEPARAEPESVTWIRGGPAPVVVADTASAHPEDSPAASGEGASVGVDVPCAFPHRQHCAP